MIERGRYWRGVSVSRPFNNARCCVRWWGCGFWPDNFGIKFHESHDLRPARTFLLVRLRGFLNHGFDAMSRSSKNKSPISRSSAPISPAGKMPGTTASRLPESKSHLARLNDRWLSLAVCLALAMAVWAVFGQTLHYGFVNYDDDFYVCKNPIVTGGLNPHKMVWVWTHDNGLGEWFPLTNISHMLDWQLYGLNAGGHHLTNILLHTATAMLLLLVLGSLRARSGAPPLWPPYSPSIHCGWNPWPGWWSARMC